MELHFDVGRAQMATLNPSLVHPKSKGTCAKSVRSFLEAGGLSTEGRPVAACQYVNFLPRIGFEHIATITGKNNQSNWSNGQARPGDVSVMSHETYGHICMWDGHQWVSDFRQNNMWPYQGDGTCFLFRFTGKIGAPVDLSGYGVFGDNSEFYTASYLLSEKPRDSHIKFKGLYNLYRNLSVSYAGNPMTRYDEYGNVILGDTTVGDTGISNYMFDFIIEKETSKKWGFTMGEKELLGKYINNEKHKTYGYGSLFFNSQKYMDQVKPVWTQEELEQIFLDNLKQRVGVVKSWAKNNGVTLTQNQLDSLVSACYNFGNGFLKKKICRMIANNPNDPNIRYEWEHLSDAQAAKSNGAKGLVKRRQEEAAWYFQ